MKKQIILVLALALTGCATGTSVAKKNEPNRGIAQDTRIEYTTDTRQFNPVCGVAPNTTVDTEGGELALNSRMERVTTYVIRTPIYDCEETQGDGRGGDWKGFYDQAGNKANQLAAAIKGVGAGTAPHLVAYFQRGKPRSWRQFSDLINTAAAEMERTTGINRGWTNNVLKQYKADNIVNLGYASSASCRITGYIDERYEEREFLRDQTVIVATTMTGGKLLPRECDKFYVSYDGREVTGRADSDVNAYSVTTQYNTLSNSTSQLKAHVTYRGSRKIVAPGYFIEIPGSTAVGTGNTVQITVQNARLNELQQVPEFANACKLSASVTIYGRKGSAWGSKKSAPLKSDKFALDANKTSTSRVVEGVALAEGQHPVVDISTGFAAGCPFYNTTLISNGRIEE